MLPGHMRHLPGWFRERPVNDTRQSGAQDVLRASVMPEVFKDGHLWDINMVLVLYHIDVCVNMLISYSCIDERRVGLMASAVPNG